MDHQSVHHKEYQYLYQSRRWKALRKQQLNKHPLCKICKEEGRLTPATVADHIIPHKGNEALFFTTNLQSLCKHHHDSDKQHQEYHGYSDRIGTDGYPTDPQHPQNSQQEKILQKINKI